MLHFRLLAVALLCSALSFAQTATGLLALVEEEHHCNFELWHEEDKARREDQGFEFVYRAKRNPDRTPEPFGGGGSVAGKHLFVVHKHAARHLHYDLRLEMDGVLKSWAVPKGPSIRPEAKRLAVHVEDHPLEYAEFEGVIPRDNYGAGAVIVWDHGRYRSAKPEDVRRQLERGLVEVEFHGHKLRGRWALARMAGTRGPCDRTTCSPVRKSVAVRWSGIRASAKVRSPNAVWSRSRIRPSSRNPHASENPKTRGNRSCSSARRLRWAVTSRVHSFSVAAFASSSVNPSAVTAA